MRICVSPEREYPVAPLPAVSGVIFNKQNHVLLIRRNRQPSAGKWSLPGGVVQLGEELEQALKREILEESEIFVKVGPLLDVSSRIIVDETGKIRYHYVLLDYLCKHVSGSPKAGSDAGDLKWIPVDRVGEFDITQGLLDVISKGFDKRLEL